MIQEGGVAVLGDTERFEVWAQMMRDIPLPTLTKPELRAAVDAIDTWFDTNAATLNAALPAAARTKMTTQQKAALLSYVIAKRYLVEQGA